MDIQSVFDKLAPDRTKLAEFIVTGEVPGVPKSEMACGLAQCPFHQHTAIASSHACDSICNLLGDGGNIIACAPHWQDPERQVRYEHNGEKYLANARLLKCLTLKPLSPEAKRALAKE